MLQQRNKFFQNEGTVLNLINWEELQALAYTLHFLCLFNCKHLQGSHIYFQNCETYGSLVM